MRGPAGFWAFVGPVEDSDDLYAAPLSGAEVRLSLTALLTFAIPGQVDATGGLRSYSSSQPMISCTILRSWSVVC